MALTLLHGQREAQPVSALGPLPALVHAQRLRQFMAAQPGEGLHRPLYVGQLAPREAGALKCGRLEVRDARVQGDHSPVTATAENRPPFVDTFAEKTFRRILSRGQALPCVPTQGHLVLLGRPTSRVNVIALKGAAGGYEFQAQCPYFDMRLDAYAQQRSATLGAERASDREGE